MNVFFNRILRRFFLVGIGTSTLILGGCFDEAREAINADFDRAVYESLHFQIAQFDEAPRFGYDVSFGLSNAVLNETVKKLIGVKIIPINPPDGFPDAYIEVTSVKLQSNVGMSDLELGLKLVSPTRNLTVKLKGKGALLFDSPTVGDENVIPLVVKLKEIKSGFSWRFLTVSNSDLLDDYVTIKTVKSLEDSLKMELPKVIIGGPSLDLNQLVTIENEDPPSQLNLSVEGPKVNLINQVNLSAFVFGSNGITAHANLDSDITAIPPAPPVAASDIASEITRLRSLMQSAPEFNQVFNEDATVKVAAKAIDTMTSKFDFLSSEEREIHIKTISHTGKLFEDKWRDDVLGEGGIFAEFTTSNPVTGRVNPGPIRHSLSSDGLSYFIDLDVSAKAKVKTHFDPLLGGGIGKVWSLNGSAKPRMEGKLEGFVDNTGPVAIAVTRHTQVCSKYDLTVKDRGELEVGVRTSNLIGDETPTIDPVVDGIPIVLELKNQNDTDDFRVEFPADFLVYEYSPLRFTLDEDGLSLGLDLEGSYSSSVPDIESLEKNIARHLKTLADNSPKSICPKTDEMVVLIAGLEFGENNEFVKVGKFLVKKATELSDTIINDLDKRQKNLLNPPRGSALHKPLEKPLKTAECIITFFNSCK